MKFAKYIFFLCISFNTCIAFAQKSIEIDSMQHLLPFQSDIVKIKTLDELTYQLRKKKDSSGIVYALQGLKLSKKINYVKGEVDALNLLGKMARNQNQLKDAEKYLLEALTVAKNKKYDHGVARGYNELGIFYKYQGESVAAIDAFLSSSAFFEAQGNYKAAIKPTYNSGDLYRNLEAYPKALKYYLKSLELCKITNDSMALGIVYLKLAMLDKDRENYKQMQLNAMKAQEIFKGLGKSKYVYNTKILIGQSYDYLDQDEKAVKIYLETLKKKSEYRVKDISDLYHNLATLYKKMAKNDSALYYYKKAQKIFKGHNDFKRLAVNYNNLGNLYVAKDEQNKALESFTKSLALQKQLQDSSLLEKTYQSLANYYKQNSAYQQALSYKDSSELVRLSINKKIKKADRYELSYLDDKRKLEAEKNRAERLTAQAESKNTIILIILVAAIVLFFVILRSRKLQEAKKIAELAYQQQKVQAQLERKQQEKKLEEMLQEQERKAINSMVNGQEEERARIANDLHDRLGSMLSVVKIHYKSVEDDLEKIKIKTRTQYEKANKLLDEACETVRKIAHNMVSGTLTKFGLLPALKELKGKIEETKTLKIELLAHGLDNRLDNSTEIQLYRVVQELLNNVIKHAQATEVTIQLLKREKDLNIMVTDNGVGFDTQQEQYEGMGLKSVKARVAEMNGQVLVDASIGNGTTITIEIPT